MRVSLLVTSVALALAAAGCGSSGSAPDNSPAGDIPDNTAFVAFRPAGQRYEIKVPEGWQRTESGAVVTFTDKLNAIRVQTRPAAAAPTVASAKADVPGAAVERAESVQRKGGDAILVVYRADSAADPVTGKVVPDTVERYAFWRDGTEAVVTLSGPVGADNVDPWRTVTDSFAWLS
nr:lipoprotein [Dactylosporangium thailandense]